MKVSSAAIDAAVIQLRAVFQENPDVPDNVRESGKKFLDDLDVWAEKLRESENAGTSSATVSNR
jgi:hypothetical protein